jgi:hypothetical protein
MLWMGKRFSLAFVFKISCACFEAAARGDARH